MSAAPADRVPRQAAREHPPLAVVFSITLTGILANTLINAPLPDIVDDFGVGRSSAGLLVAAGTLPGIVVAPAVGLLADRFGRRPVLLPCLTVFGLAGMAGAAAPSFEALVGLRAAQGIGSAGLINLAVVLLADHWDGAARARVIGQNAAVLTISVAVLPAAGGVLAEVWGWRASFLPYGFALFTAAAVVRWVPRADRPDPPSVAAQVRAALDEARNPVIWGAIAYGTVVFVLIFGLFLTALPLLLADEFSLGPMARGLVLSAPALGSTAVALQLGRLRPRFGARRLLLVASALFVVAFAAIGAAPALGVLLAGALLYGLGEGAAIPTAQDLVAGAASSHGRGAVVALWVGAARFGQTIGPLATGAAVGWFGPRSAFLAGSGVAAGLFAGQVVLARSGWRRPLSNHHRPPAGSN